MKLTEENFMTIDQDVPGFALSYLINGDSSGLTGEDLKECKEFEDYFSDLAEKMSDDNGKWHWHLDVPDDEPDFMWHPDSVVWDLGNDYYHCHVIMIKEELIR